MRFLEPDIGIWVAAAFAAIALVKWRSHIRFAAVGRLAAVRRRAYGASWLRRLPFAVLAIAAAFTALAMMEPVIPYSQETVQSHGLDIIILLDLSSSMQEPMDSRFADLTLPLKGPAPKTRLDAVKDAVRQFIRLRHDDRIGLVVFSDNPYVVSPLTFDHEYLLHYVDLIDSHILEGEGQTAIGDGLALSNFVLAKQATAESHGHQVVVLFTDGENNRGREPVDVLAESKAADIRVHVIGVDIEQEVQNKPTVQALIHAIQRNGGRYFSASSEKSLISASREIDSIEKGLLVSRVYVRDVPVYQWFAVPALIALVAAFGVRMVPYFVDQT
ncbi:MAG TPA: VWA domain-containing protein [Vicinamibacterales bacterium]|jgi:Ca-activated chloride channel family protein